MTESGPEAVQSPAPPLGAEELDVLLGADELDALQAAYRRRLLGRFAPEPLLWLALLPEWPQALAEQCRFPTGAAGSLSDLVRQLVGAGLAEQRESLEDSGELMRTFWVSPSRRPELGGYLRQTLTHEQLLEGVDGISAALDSAVAGSPGRWPQAETWRQVSVLRLDPTGGQLNDAVDNMLGGGRTEQAMALIGAAQAMGDVIGEPLVSAARRAGWRLDRAHRQAVDLRMLADYLPRPQLEHVVEALLDGRTPVVHLLGHAGVGKTMLVRSLASGEYARRHGRGEFPVARIDFDYLDPRYPETRPAELLLALAADLTGYSASRTHLRHLRQFEDAAAALHESLASGPGTGLPRGRGANLPHGGTGGADPALLHRAVDIFADYLDELAKGRGPVVLILDTCEELAKLHAPGAPAPALERTFQIIERIRLRTTQVRVLLAGRRPLVQRTGTAGWPSDVCLRTRDYVTVVPVGGFTLGEAIEYIQRRDPRRLVSLELRDAVLSRCLREGADEGQVNPFDLAGYLDWALDEPDLDPQALAAASGDPYVEQRILGRIRDTAVRDALPVAVQLGRFDHQMITPALARYGIDPEAAFSGLAGQEWATAVSFRPDGRPRVIEIDEHLRARLRAVLDADPVLAVDRAALGADLHALVAKHAVADLPVETVEAALRLLPPERAGQMWADFEANIAAAGEWGWAVQVLPRAAAVEAELAESRPQTVMAAILATQAAAMLRQPGRPGVRQLWDDVAGLAERHPDPEQRRRLRFRAACGRLACAGSSNVGTRLGSAQIRLPDHDPLVIEPELRADVEVLLGQADGVRELPWSALAAVDGLTSSGFPLAPPLRGIADALAEHADPRIAATAKLARATGRLWASDLPAAIADVEHALRRLAAWAPADVAAGQPADVAGQPVVVGAGQPLDWVPASRLLDRARLARLCCARLAGERPQRSWLDRWRADALRHLDDIDAERLVSASIELDEDWRPATMRVLTDAAARESYVPGRRPTHHWHRRAMPLRPLLMRALGELGPVDAAVHELKERREAALSAGDDPNTVVACDAMLIELSRIYRTTQLTGAVHRLARSNEPELRSEAHAVLRLVSGDVLVVDKSPTAGDHGSDLALQVDQLEAKRLRRVSEVPDPEAAVADAIRGLIASGRLLAAGSDVLGAALRADALLGIPEVAAHVDRLPPRLVARTALAEGELLALRLPDPACSLLRLARQGFLRAGDEVAAERARILLVLTAARAAPATGVPSKPKLPEEELQPPDTPVSAQRLGEAWLLRRSVADAIVRGAPLPPVTDPSPELQLVFSHLTRAATPPPPASPPAQPAGASYGQVFPAEQTRSDVVDQYFRDAALRPSEPAPRWEQHMVARQPRTPLPRDLIVARSRPRRRWLLLGLLFGVFVAVSLLLYSAWPWDAGGGPPPGTTESPFPWMLVVLIALVPAALVTSGWVLIRARRRATPPSHSLPLPSYSLPPVAPAGTGQEAWYKQRTVAVYLAEKATEWWSCRLILTETELRIIPEDHEPSGPDGVFRSGIETSNFRYLVVPAVRLGQRTVEDVSDMVPALPSGAPRQLPVQVYGLRVPSPTKPPGARVVWRRPDPSLSVSVVYRGPSHLRPTYRATYRSWPDMPCRLLYLVGEPVPTASGGWRLRVTGAVSEQAQYTEARGRLKGEELLGPDDIQDGHPSLVMLQAEPADGPPRPLGRLREGMVGIGLGLHDVGVHWVLVVPPLPDALAADIIRRTVSTSDAGVASHPRMVLNLAYDLRSMIGLDDPAAADVLLLCRATAL